MGKIDKLELCRKCPPRRVKDKHITELKSFECVSSVITITTIMKTERDKMGAMRILLVIDDDICV